MGREGCWHNINELIDLIDSERALWKVIPFSLDADVTIDWV